MTPKHVKPDTAPSCPNAACALVLGDRAGNERAASRRHCDQRVILGLRDGVWRIVDRSPLS